MTEYTFDENILSDLHKDAYGCRPRGDFWDRWESSSDDEKQKIWDNLVIDLEHEIARERTAEAEAIENFNKKVAEIGIRGFVNSLNLADWELSDPGMICYIAGLPYEMESHFMEISKEVNQRLYEKETNND